MDKTVFFETIKCDNEEIFYLWYHQQRISKTIGLNINLSDYIYPPTSDLLKCKVIYDKNNILEVQYNKYISKEIHSFKIIYEDNIDYKYKYLDRQDLDFLYQQKSFYDEIIIVKNNLITDTSIANIAIYDGQYWITPKIPLLYGTTRARYIDEKKLILQDITVEQLINAKKIALLNAMVDFKIIDNFDIIL